MTSLSDFWFVKELRRLRLLFVLSLCFAAGQQYVVNHHRKYIYCVKL